MRNGFTREKVQKVVSKTGIQIKFFPLCFIHVVSKDEVIYKVFGLVCFSWNEFWRVAIPCHNGA